jgi:hypothetical protein
VKTNVLAVLLLLVLTGCGGGSSSNSQNTPTIPQMAGSWEIVANSNSPVSGTAAQQTFIETVISQNSGNWQGNSTQLIGVQFFQAANDFYNFGYQIGGFCGASSANLTGTVSATNAVTFTLNEGGIVFTGAGALGSDGSISGSYAGGSNGCLDSGTFVAKQTKPLSGTFSHNYNGDPTLLISLNEGTATPPAVPSLTATGSDSTNGSFTLTGSAVGNAGVVSGTVSGQSVTYYGLLVPHANIGSVKNFPLLLVVNSSFQLIGMLQ